MSDDQNQTATPDSGPANSAMPPEQETTPLLVAPTTSSEVNTVRPLLIPHASFNIEDTYFEFDSSFVLPLGLTFDAQPLKKLLDDHPGSKLSIFGHTDPVGKDTYNKTLSGRRAQAIFGLLTRNVDLWKDLYFRHDTLGNDPWGVRSIQVMLNRVGPTKAGNVNGVLDDGTRQALKDFEEEKSPPAKGFDKKQEIDPDTFEVLARLYMDAICTDDDSKQVQLKPDDFLAGGTGKDGKGDYQGCGEFNPLMMFSKKEKTHFDQEEHKEERNTENRVNRRITMLLYPAGARIDPEKWPCPSVKEGIEKCRLRFFSDAPRRRSNLDERREHKDEKANPDMVGTFACRFYDRHYSESLYNRKEKQTHYVEVQVLDDKGNPLPDVKMVLVKGDGSQITAQTDPNGVARWNALRKEDVRIGFADSDYFPEEQVLPQETPPGNNVPNQPDSPSEPSDAFPLTEEGSDQAALEASSVAPGRFPRLASDQEM